MTLITSVNNNYPDHVTDLLDLHGLSPVFLQVITSTIEPDLKRINEAVRVKQQELKAERLRLIKEKMQKLEADSSDSSDSSSDGTPSHLNTFSSFIQATFKNTSRQTGVCLM